VTREPFHHHRTKGGAVPAAVGTTRRAGRGRRGPANARGIEGEERTAAARIERMAASLGRSRRPSTSSYQIERLRARTLRRLPFGRPPPGRPAARRPRAERPAEAAAPAAEGPLRALGRGLVHPQVAAAELLAVELLDRRRGRLVRGERDEREPARRPLMRSVGTTTSVISPPGRTAPGAARASCRSSCFRRRPSCHRSPSSLGLWAAGSGPAGTLSRPHPPPHTQAAATTQAGRHIISQSARESGGRSSSPPAGRPPH